MKTIIPICIAAVLVLVAYGPTPARYERAQREIRQRDLPKLVLLRCEVATNEFRTGYLEVALDTNEVTGEVVTVLRTAVGTSVSTNYVIGYIENGEPVELMSVKK